MIRSSHGSWCCWGDIFPLHSVGFFGKDDDGVVVLEEI